MIPIKTSGNTAMVGRLDLVSEVYDCPSRRMAASDCDDNF
jgi:hypothetical protein